VKALRDAAAKLPKIIQDNWILKIGHCPFRKLLWLIPFMLAKKLLSFKLSFAKNEIASIVCGAKLRATRAVCVSENFLGYRPSVLKCMARI